MILCSMRSVGSLRSLVTDTNFFGFPCVLSGDTQLLAGFIMRKDIQQSLGGCGMWVCIN